MDTYPDGSAGLGERFQAMITSPDLQSLCDVVFIVGNQKFPAHRAVLACSSPVFRKMFTTGMREATSRQFPLEIPLTGLDPISWEICLHYMYTGKAFLKDDETALLALSSAHKYQLEELCSFIERFLIAQRKSENCAKLFNTAQVYDLKGLESSCLSYIDQHFEEVSGSAKFLEECGKDLFMQIIESKELIVKSEMTVLSCITAWIQADVEGRSSYLDEMLKMVQLSKVTEMDLTSMGRKTMSFPCKSFQSALLEKWVSEKPETENDEILDHLIPRQRSLESFTLIHRLLDKANFMSEENTPWKRLPGRNILIRLKVNPSDDENFSSRSICQKRDTPFIFGANMNKGFGHRQHEKAVDHRSRKYISLYLESEPLSSTSAIDAKMMLKFFVVNRKNPSATFSQSLKCQDSPLKRRNGFFEFMLLDALKLYIEENPKSVLLGVNVVLL